MHTYFQILRLLRENILQGNTLNKLQKLGLDGIEGNLLTILIRVSSSGRI